MRTLTSELFHSVIVREYILPNSERRIGKVDISTHSDHCLRCKDSNIAELIGQSLIDYCFDQEEQSGKDIATLLKIALEMRVKNRLEAEKESTLLKQGFFGEALLYAVLFELFGADTLICRGRLFDVLSKKESPGYDAFHLIETEDRINLWFGEAKFHENYKKAAKSVAKSIKGSLNAEYLKQNLIAIINHKAEIRNEKMKRILEKWYDSGFVIKLEDIVAQENMKLIYPALIVYDDTMCGYDDMIRAVVSEINKQIADQQIEVPNFCSIFFILLPMSNVRKVKLDVIEWIKRKRI